MLPTAAPEVTEVSSRLRVSAQRLIQDKSRKQSEPRTSWELREARRATTGGTIVFLLTETRSVSSFYRLRLTLLEWTEQKHVPLFNEALPEGLKRRSQTVRVWWRWPRDPLFLLGQPTVGQSLGSSSRPDVKHKIRINNIRI